VEVQNYLDNTGVQVADVVVGLERMQSMTLSDVEAIDGKFDYYCWDVYSRVSEFYQQSEENRKWRSLTLQAVEAGNNPTAELAQHVAMRIVKAHLATMARINVQYDLLPRESEILHLHFWEKAYQLLKDRGAIYYVSEGKNRGCWVMNTGGSGSDATREEAEDDEKIIVPIGRNCHLRRQGYRLPAMETRASGFGLSLWIVRYARRTSDLGDND